MKKTLFFIGLAVAATACNPSSKSAYAISGTLPAGDATEMFYLMKGTDVLDSAAVADNAFQFKGTITDESPSQVTVINAKNPRQATLGASLFLEAGKAVVEFDAEGRASVSGTISNDASKAFKEFVETLDDEDEDGYYAAIVNSAKENTGNAFGLDQLYMACIYKIIDGQEALDLLEEFPEKMKTNKKGESVRIMSEASIKTAIGQPFIDFALASIENGEALSLKSVVEKEGNRYILLDFWASWCGPCMREVPYLIEAYEKYHAKGFEIFGCSLDSDAESWKAAVADKKMNWIHVSDIKYWDCEGANLYGVRSIPANFLIDCSTGAIIASDLRGNALIEKIGELVD